MTSALFCISLSDLSICDWMFLPAVFLIFAMPLLSLPAGVIPGRQLVFHFLTFDVQVKSGHLLEPTSIVLC